MLNNPTGYNGKDNLVVLGIASAHSGPNGNPLLISVNRSSDDTTDGIELTGAQIPCNSIVRLTGSYSVNGDEKTFNVDSYVLIQNLYSKYNEDKNASTDNATHSDGSDSSQTKSSMGNQTGTTSTADDKSSTNDSDSSQNNQSTGNQTSTASKQDSGTTSQDQSGTSSTTSSVSLNGKNVGNDNPIAVQSLLLDPETYNDAASITLIGQTSDIDSDEPGAEPILYPVGASASNSDYEEEQIKLTGIPVDNDSIVKLKGTFSIDSGTKVFNVTSCEIIQHLPSTTKLPDNAKVDFGTTKNPIPVDFLLQNPKEYSGQSNITVLGVTSQLPSDDGNPVLYDSANNTNSEDKIYLAGDQVPQNSLVLLTGSYKVNGTTKTFVVDSCKLIQTYYSTY